MSTTYTNEWMNILLSKIRNRGIKREPEPADNLAHRVINFRFYTQSGVPFDLVDILPTDAQAHSLNDHFRV